MNLTNITLPTATKFGTFQIENMDATYFRFDEKDSDFVLDPDFLIVAERDANKRQHPMSKDMYDNLKRELLNQFSSRK